MLLRHIFHSSLHRVLPASGPADHHPRCAAPGGEPGARRRPRCSAGACPGADEGQRDGLGGRGGLLQSQQRHHQRGQRGGRPLQHQVSKQQNSCQRT